MKLYWRVKRNGKWTWRPLVVDDVFTQTIIDRLAYQSGLREEEEGDLVARVAKELFTIQIVQLYDHGENRRSKNYLVKNNEAKELSSRMRRGIRAEYLGTARLDNSCGIGGIPSKSNLLKTEVKAPKRWTPLMRVIPPKDYRTAEAVRGREDRESGAGVTVSSLRIGFGGERSSGRKL